MNIREALVAGNRKLRSTSQSPNLDAEVLLSYVLKKDRAWLYANPDKKLSRLQLTTYNLLIRKRANYVPVAYLTGHKEFFGLDFRVTPSVLIPRPETELLVEMSLKNLQSKILNLKSVIDLGTGSGCIVVSLAKNSKKIKLYAIDNSSAALKIAKINARRHGVARKIKFLRGNLLSPFLQPKILNLKSSIILANLPYLTPKQYNSNRDLKHEPRSALVGGRNGLKYYRELFEELRIFRHAGLDPASRSMDSRLRGNESIVLLIEHNPSQKRAIESLTKRFFPKAKIKFHKDLAGRDRVTEIKTSGQS